MTRPLDTVAFDLDGTLVDTMTIVPRAYADTIRSLGGPDLAPDEITQVWHIGPTTTVLGHFLRRSISTSDLDRFYDTFEDAIQSIEPFDGVVAMLDALLDRGLRLGVYTTATHRAATVMLTRAGLSERLHALIGGDDVTYPKPHPEGLQLLCKQLGTTTRRTAYVGDAQVDTRCANAALSLAIHAAWGTTTNTIVGPADAIAKTPSDVLNIVLDTTNGTPPSP
jgi:HAD superfamily hydrolase (TIGR01549 family)